VWSLKPIPKEGLYILLMSSCLMPDLAEHHGQKYVSYSVCAHKKFTQNIGPLCTLNFTGGQNVNVYTHF